MGNRKTYYEAHQDVRTAGANFLYQLCSSLGIIWLAKKLPFLELKDWVKRRDI